MHYLPLIEKKKEATGDINLAQWRGWRKNAECLMPKSLIFLILINIYIFRPVQFLFLFLFFLKTDTSRSKGHYSTFSFIYGERKSQRKQNGSRQFTSITLLHLTFQKVVFCQFLQTFQTWSHKHTASCKRTPTIQVVLSPEPASSLYYGPRVGVSFFLVPEKANFLFPNFS